MPKNIEANTVASFVLPVIVMYLALVALCSTNLSIQSLSVNFGPELLFAEAGYGETPLSAADIAMHSTLAPDISREPVTAARVSENTSPPQALLSWPDRPAPPTCPPSAKYKAKEEAALEVVQWRYPAQ
jgi:hypothetical protein